METRQRLAALEALRFGAALAVVLWHHQHFAPAGRPADLLGQPGAALLRPVYLYGAMGVQFFWLLSGFVFFTRYLEPVADGVVGAWRFAVRRFSRLYPLHLLTLLIVIALQQWVQAVGAAARYHYRAGEELIYPTPPQGLPDQLTMTSGWQVRQTAFDYNGPIWSVSLELLAYLLFFLLAVTTFRWCRRTPGRRGVWFATLAVLAVSALVAVADDLPHVTLVECVALFLLGGVLTEVRRRATPSHRTGLHLAAAATVGLAVAVLLGRDPARGTDLLGGTRLLVVAAFAALILSASLAPRVRRTGSLRRWAERAGACTYGMYLLHVPLQLAVMAAFATWDRTVPAGSPLFLAAFLVALVLLAAWVHAHVEAPAQRWLRARLLRPSASAV
ncbi:acyltransferase family protein [Nocardioides sp.]|uniref:acyltransferase family protein n=1 Tax=Nocardioides sp. TaxID=35761 RepID=UPI003514DB4E